MAHFAQLDSNNIVIQVIVISDDDTSDANGVESESIGVGVCQKIVGADTIWKKTSYHNRMRGRYAGIGYTYMENVQTLGVASTDIFIPQQPFPSWSIGTTFARWEPPIALPSLTDEQEAAGYRYMWDESAYQADNTVGWALTTFP